MSKDYIIEAIINAIHLRLPFYRIWIDGELMCERTFWPNAQQFNIHEIMYVSLAAGQHTYKFEPIDPTLGKVWTESIEVRVAEDNRTLLTHGMHKIEDTTQEFTFRV